MIKKKIKEMRKKKGLSITELARLAKVSKSYLSQLERGLQINPSLQFLKKIAIPLDTTIEYFLLDENSKGSEENDFDAEWGVLLRKAIDEGMQKEEFKEYLHYLRYQNWKKKSNS